MTVALFLQILLAMFFGAMASQYVYGWLREKKLKDTEEELQVIVLGDEDDFIISYPSTLSKPQIARIKDEFHKWRTGTKRVLVVSGGIKVTAVSRGKVGQ